MGNIIEVFSFSLNNIIIIIEFEIILLRRTEGGAGNGVGGCYQRMGYLPVVC